MKGTRKNAEDIQHEISALEQEILSLQTSYANKLTVDDIKVAIQDIAFKVYYQPIVRLKNGELMGFEALLRWHHPLRGVIMPNEFIPLAVENGLMIPIENMVMHEASMQLSQWQKDYRQHRRLFMAVNLSPDYFEHPPLVKEVERVLTFNKINPGTLRLEITEQPLIQDLDTAVDTLKKLKDLGTRISIDDFGTGYSSLAYIHRLPVESLKIDMVFVQGLRPGSRPFDIVRMILQLAERLGLDVIAEGVETEEQLTSLISLGCEYGQGYLFSPAVEAKTAEEMLKKGAFRVRHLLGVTIIDR